MKRLFSAIVAAAMILPLIPAVVLADIGNACASGQLANAQTSNLVGASASVSGNDVTYTFESFTDEGSAGTGVPGLIEFCVFPDSLPTSVAVVAVGDDGSDWVDPPGPDSFSVHRTGGNPSNIGLDGTDTEIGTATWSSAPPNNYDRILLHINHAAECAALGASAETCWVFPGTECRDDCGGGGDAAALTATKDAVGSYDNTYTWTIDKSVDDDLIKDVGGNVDFDYTVDVSHGPGTIGNVTVSGTITVSNSNTASVALTSISDSLSDDTVCEITDSEDLTAESGDNVYTYSCDLSALPEGDLFNTVTVAWDAQTLSDDSELAGGSDTFTTEDPIEFTLADTIDECVDVSDEFNGGDADQEHTFCVGDEGDPDFSFDYSRTVPVPEFGCVEYDNTATFTTNDTETSDDDDQTVTVCGPVQTGALTIGFWQNKNGQALIKGAATTAGVCNITPSLRAYAPFQDLSATATCNQVASYVTTVIKAANASGSSMNAMLKAQMLATALNVYFHPSIGTTAIDLDQVCKNIASCTIYEDVGAAFGGASSLTVNAMLTFAASQSNVGGSVWYGQDKPTQELAKDAFDAINNEVAFGA